MNFTTEGIGAEVKLTASGPTKKSYEASLKGERLKAVESKWVAIARDQAKLPGFRRGRISDEVVIEQLGSWIRREVTQEVANVVVQEIVKREDLKIVYSPLVSKVDYHFGERLSLEAVFEIEPSLVVKNYKGLVLERKRRKISEEEVEVELGRLLQESETQYLVPIEEKTRENAGHWALISARFGGRLNGASGDPASESLLQWGQELISVDEECLPLGMREALEGLGAGQSKIWEMPIDDDCPTLELQGKTMAGRLELLELKRMEGAHCGRGQEAQEYAGQMAKWKEEVRAVLNQRLEARSQGILRDQITAELLRENSVDVPEAELEIRASELLGRARTLFALSGREIAPEHDNELRVKYSIEAAN